MDALNKIREIIGISWCGFLLLLTFILLWVIAIIATGAGVNLFDVKWNFENSGAFGDSFGPLATFMASIAALSAIAAYRAQSSEISRMQQRQTQEDDRREREQKAFERRQLESDLRSEKVAFEETYFKLLEAFRNIVAQIDVKGHGSLRVGHDAFASILNYTENTLHTANGNAATAWNDTISKYKNDLNHYFRFLYHIVLFVDNSSIKNKYEYIRFLRATLSESEIILIGLNCEHGEGRVKFLPLIEEYCLMHNISPQSRARWFAKTVIAERAFERD